MKLILVVVVTIALISLTQGKNVSKELPAYVQSLRNLQREPPISDDQLRATITTEWIEQKLDNFDPDETRTWQMRYMINAEYFEKGGPMFIFVGGEWDITPGMASYGLFVDMAKEHNGILFYTEHRYYGESKPTSDITVENLKYQHSKQALADLAHFIKYKRETETTLANSKVIMAGCSYSAALVVWFKRQYPELLAGGWAVSAPVLAKIDFREYKEVVGDAIRELGSQQCYDRIQHGITELEWMFANKRSSEVKAMMKICNNFDENNDLDLWTLFGTIANIFGGLVQYQREGGEHIPRMCNYLMEFDDDVTAISRSVLLWFNSSACLDLSYKSTLNLYLDSTYKYGEDRPWFYQLCNELGWYKSTGSVNQPFGTKVPTIFFTTLCADIFGASVYTNENIQAKVAQTNADFGGLSPEVENIYMTHGGLDPWSPIGLTEGDDVTVIPRASHSGRKCRFLTIRRNKLFQTVHCASHCAGLGSISASNSAEMRAAKQRIVELVREWLAELPNRQ